MPTDPTTDDRELPPLHATLAAGTRLVGSGVVVGVPAGLVIVAVGLAAGWPTDESVSTAFGVGTTALGLGVLGWAGSILAGRGVEAAARHATPGREWSERDSRRAMLRVAGFGLGIVLGVGLLDVVI